MDCLLESIHLAPGLLPSGQEVDLENTNLKGIAMK